MKNLNNSPLTVNYYLRDAKATNTTPVVMYVRYGGYTVKYPTGLSVSVKKWNQNENRVRKGFPASHEVNLQLTSKETEAIKTFVKFQNENHRNPTVEELKALFKLNPILTKTNKEQDVQDKTVDLFGFIDEFLKDCETKIVDRTGTPMAKVTVRVYKQAFRLLKEFKEKHYKSRPFSYEHIDTAFYKNFRKFLEKDFSTNTVGKHLRTVKTFMLEAQSYGHLPNFNSRQFKGVTEKTDAIALTEEEVNHLYSLDLADNPRIERVRDLFIVGVRTGLRFSDYSNITRDNIDMGNDEIVIIAQKTQDEIVIPLHRQVKAIISKYEGKTANSLPKSLSNQKMNDYLKELGIKAELNELVKTKKTKGGVLQVEEKPKHDMISTHTARRTFATIEYLAGQPIEVIRAITGHKSESSFMKYIKIPPRGKAAIMRESWKLREEKEETKIIQLKAI